MKPEVWIREMTFSDSKKISFEKDEIVIIVGPNNSGKSAALKESAKLIQQKGEPGKVVRDLIVEKDVSSPILNYLKEVSTEYYQGNSEPFLRGYGYNIYKGNINSYWEQSSAGLGELYPLFVSSINTEQRLQAANPPSNISLTTEAPQHPIHFLQRDDSIEEKFSDYFRLAFGQDLIVHRNAGSIVPLYVGKRPVPDAGKDRVSIDYVQAVEKLDLLHEQGDGMRAFVGVLLNCFVANQSIFLIDEPEAFLHPPQARLLGLMLAKNLPERRQLFVATHSEDFLKGVLDSEVSKIRILRLQRSGNVNDVSELKSEDVKTIWKDSLLRHSNILNGLFHSHVVICESDSDCRFFAAILSALYEDSNKASPDIFFTHCGGKHRLPTAIKALKRLNVNLRIIADFDVLNDINPLKEICESSGIDWPACETDWRTIKSAVEQKRPEFLTADLKAEIDSIIGTVAERIFPKDRIKQIEKALKKASPWTEAKMVGKAYIPNGMASQAFDRLKGTLESGGVSILEVGELESFVKSIGNHGPKWVNDVLQKDLKNDPELEIARKFVGSLVKKT